MATKAFKSEKIEALKENVAKAKVAIVADYKGLTVSEITQLRRELHKEGAEYTVVKNTLAKLAIKDTPYEGISAFLEGPSAIVFGYEDQVGPAKVLTKFIKKVKKTEIKGGCLDNKELSSDEVKKLSELPSKEELYAKILGSVNSPAQGIVNTVNGVFRQLVIAMEEIRKQKESQ